MNATCKKYSWDEWFWQLRAAKGTSVATVLRDPNTGQVTRETIDVSKLKYARATYESGEEHDKPPPPPLQTWRIWCMLHGVEYPNFASRVLLNAWERERTDVAWSYYTKFDNDLEESSILIRWFWLTQCKNPEYLFSQNLMRKVCKKMKAVLRTAQSEYEFLALYDAKDDRSVTLMEGLVDVWADLIQENMPRSNTRPLGSFCWKCGVSYWQHKPRKCAVCEVARYCSEHCQQKHWPEHKVVCKALKMNGGMFNERGVADLC